MNAKSSFVTGKAMLKFQVAAIFSSLANNLCNMTNAFMVGNMLDNNSLSAISLTSPIVWTLGLIVPLFALGASMLVGKAIGNQNIHSSKCIYSTAIISCLIASFILMSVGYLSMDKIVYLICTDHTDLAHLARQYLVSYLLILPILSIYQPLTSFTNVEGNPTIVSRSIIFVCVSNILFNWLLIPKFGINGSAYATGVSNLLGLALLLLSRYRYPSLLSLVGPSGYIKGTLANNLHQGLPIMLPTLLGNIATFCCNTIVLNNTGETGIFIWSVCCQIFTIGRIIYKVPYTLILAMGSVLIGEHDYSGLRIMLRKSARMTILTTVSVILFIELWPSLIISIFGGSGQMLTYAQAPIRIYTLSLLFLIFFRIIIANYQILGHTTICLVNSTLQLVLMVVPPFLLSLISPDLLWWGFPLGFFILFIIDRLTVLNIYRKDKTVSWLSLVPKAESDPSINVSVKCDENDLSSTIRQVNTFLSICEIDPIVQNHVELCCEEMMSIITRQNRNSHKSDVFDLHIIHHPERIQVVIKDAGTPFNPVHVFSDSAADALEKGEKMHLKTRLINALCNDLSYNYMNGLNVTYMSFPLVAKE